MSGNPDPNPDRESAEKPQEVSTDGARQGVELNRMRWVLGTSVVAAVVALVVVLLVMF